MFLHMNITSLVIDFAFPICQRAYISTCSINIFVQIIADVKDPILLALCLHLVFERTFVLLPDPLTLH